MSHEQDQSGSTSSSDFSARGSRAAHLQALETAGINAYPAEVPTITHTTRQIVEMFDDLSGMQVGIAGRITARREHSKTNFYDLEDQEGKVQVKLTKDEEDRNKTLVAQNFDIGDIIGVRGEVIKTRTGEVTVDGSEFTMLAKALEPPPSARFGITDPEVSRRHRFLELMSNPKARERFRARARMVQLMREEFLGAGFLEVETPVLDVTYGGASATPFTTRMNALDSEMYLRIANELYLKRLVGGNMGPVFEFSRNFRNEGMDRTHNPEFTAVELYKPYSDYKEMMALAEGVFERIAVDMHGTTEVKYGGQLIDFSAPWKRITVYDGIREAYGVDPETVPDHDLESLLAKAIRDRALENITDTLGIDPEGNDVHLISDLIDERGDVEMRKYPRRGDKILALFEHFYDGKLIQPTFVLDYPRVTSPLTKAHRQDPELVERFECYVAGFEVMNCYTELNDPREQRKRLEEEQRRRIGGHQDAMPYDEDFLAAMAHGFPPMGGIGISIDRMAMVLTGTEHIRDIILFPPVKDRSVKGGLESLGE